MERDDLSSRPLAPFLPPAPRPPARASLALGFLADLASVGVFVLIGRLSHGESDSAGGFLSTAWPFAVGVAGGYVPVVPLHWAVADVRSAGVTVVAKTVLIGMILRAGVQHEGTPLAFVVVTLAVLSAFMLGWRLLAIRFPLFRPASAGPTSPADAPSIL